MAAPKPAPTSAPKAPAPMRSAPAISGLDKFLAIAAAVAGLVAAGSVGYLYYLFQNAS
jgi:hypothetical protein